MGRCRGLAPPMCPHLPPTMAAPSSCSRPLSAGSNVSSWFPAITTLCLCGSLESQAVNSRTWVIHDIRNIYCNIFGLKTEMFEKSCLNRVKIIVFKTTAHLCHRATPGEVASVNEHVAIGNIHLEVGREAVGVGHAHKPQLGRLGGRGRRPDLGGG